jgi:hypothetical protein
LTANIKLKLRSGKTHMQRKSLIFFAIGAFSAVVPLSLSAENVISPDRTWADAEGCNVLAGNWSGQAFTIVTREEIRFWETTCFINETQYADGQSLNLMTTCEDLEDTRQEVFQFAARADGSARLYHEGYNWEASLDGC